MKKHLALLLLTSLLVVSACQQSPQDSTVRQSQVESQIDASPSPTFTSHSESIYTYKGQGQISLSATLPVEINLSINHQHYGTFTLTDEPFNLDIGEFSIDGDNLVNYSYKDPYKGMIHLKHNSPTISDIYTGTEFTEEELSQLDTYIYSEVEDGFPGAVLLIMKNGEIVKNTAYGNAAIYDGLETLETPQPMKTNTLFDLASITKVYATTFAIMKMEDEGLLNTSDYVYQYLDDFNTADKSSITIEHLLTHTSGFSASHKFYNPDNKLGEEFYSLDKSNTLSLIASLPLKYPTGTDSLYSDLGFICLGAIIESVSGMSLDTYVEETIYQKLDLTNTLYRPLDKGFLASDIAATERVGNTRDNKYEWPQVRTYTLQGEVHDELAYYSMNGISGNAGLFSNAYDMAVMSQLLLNGGAYGDNRLFDSDTVSKFTTKSTLNQRYCLGFDSSSHKNNYKRYSLLASNEAYGKTGWTGTDVLIDPAHHLVVVLLTNKRHTPIEKGSFLGSDYQTGQYAPIISQIYEMLLDTKTYDYAYDKSDIRDEKSLTNISLGIDRIEDYIELFFANKNVGLITNTSGKDSLGISSIDVLYDKTNLVALFSPEHGIDGLLKAGERYGSTIEPSTDLPIYSLYGKDLKPTNQMLDNLDLMAFDIQDVGARFYTYIYTMLNAMEACAQNNVEFLVFDRPNPLGGTRIEGNIIEEDYTSFVGMYPLPIRHGLTVGELAMYINDTYNIGCDLTVIPMNNWNRTLYYEDTSLEFVAPSPNMRTASTAVVYPGTCLLEGTNISEGRGTDYPSIDWCTFH